MSSLSPPERAARTISLEWSPLAGGPTTIAYRDYGAGPCIVILHGGWGYGAHPFDAQIETLASAFRVVVPDRSGYGRSTPIERLGPDFHRQAALETLALLEALGESEAAWWGHSDGAVIAAMAGINHPESCTALILEALHVSTAKPASRQFFQRMATEPESFGKTLSARLAQEHGEAHWRRVLQLDGRAWLDLAANHDAEADLYQGRLNEIAIPTLVIHGGADPRSEPGEFDAIATAIPHAVVEFLPHAGHSPHSEPDTSAAVSQAAWTFLRNLSRTQP